MVVVYRLRGLRKYFRSVIDMKVTIDMAREDFGVLMQSLSDAELALLRAYTSCDKCAVCGNDRPSVESYGRMEQARQAINDVKSMMAKGIRRHA